MLRAQSLHFTFADWQPTLFFIMLNTSCFLRLIGFFPLFRLLRTFCLHLLDSHVVFFVPDALLTLAGELRPPLATAFIGLGQRLLLG
jgi:hypothetical protein